MSFPLTTIGAGSEDWADTILKIGVACQLYPDLAFGRGEVVSFTMTDHSELKEGLSAGMTAGGE